MAVDEATTIPAAAQDSDLDPAAFLKSVRELSEKREREDTERYRQLEEKVQKERQERAARRAERARSIPPDKPNTISSPSSRTLSRTATNANLVSSPPVTMTPPSNAKAMDPSKTTSPKMDADVPEFKGFGSIKRSSASVSNRSSVRSSTSEVPALSSVQAAAPVTGIANLDTTPTESSQQSATGLARSGTLTWNRRPQSQIGGSRPQSQVAGSRPQSQLSGSQPQSVAAPSMGSRSPHARNDSVDKPEPSRDQIAASLGARDPSWFKQTPDRGTGSAAFRKSQVEEKADDTPARMGRRGLPGLSREMSREPEDQNSPPSSVSLRSDSASRDDSVRGSIVSAGSRFSATSTSSNNKLDLKALIAEDEGQRKVSPTYNLPPEEAPTTSTETTGIARALTMSSSRARVAGLDRPSSPTKGMGGFVQSAMMKRSDSQNKRWSAQPGARLSRSNSIASNRSGLGGLQSSNSMPKLDPTSVAAEPAKQPFPRPTSSSNDLTKLVTAQDNDGFVKPALPAHSHGHSRSKSVASNHSTNDDIPASPGSPSKRFSPLKSSWLESSLTKPESPKQMPAKNSQPSWMADLASRKAQRGSVDLGTPVSASGEGSRPSSPVKQSPFGQGMLKRADSRDLSKTPTPATPANKLSPFKFAEKTEHSTSAAPRLPEPEFAKSLEDPIRFLSAPKALALQEVPSTASEAVPEDPAPAAVPESEPEAEPEMLPSSTAAPKPRSPLLPSQPATPEFGLARERSKSVLKRHSPSPVPDKTRLDTAPRPAIDFRGQLKSRPPPEPKSGQQPEFLAKVGALRKTQQEKFVSPDVLKDNILRGKSGLAQTGGPVKTTRRDELKEGLLAKKDEFKKAKEEGRDLPGAVHARKISETKPPVAPSKPEALVKRELLGRSDSARSAASASSVDREREATPEALTRAKSLKSRALREPSKDKPKEMASAQPEMSRKEPIKQVSLPITTSDEQNVEPLSKRTSAPLVAEPKLIKEHSKLASRFNPGLASILARGPPSQLPSRNESPANSGAFLPPATRSSEPPAAGAPLEDMRKDRAKGPKRRKAGARPATSEVPAAPVESKVQADSSKTSTPIEAAIEKSSSVLPSDSKFSRARNTPTVNSPAAIHEQSLNKPPQPASIGVEPVQDTAAPVTPLKVQTRNVPGAMGALVKASLQKPPQGLTASQDAESKDQITPARKPPHASRTTPATDMSATPPPIIAVPEFKGFSATRSSKSAQATVAAEDDKENEGALPSVNIATSLWGRRPIPAKADPPAKIQLPNKKDEEAAMRSAGLLAASPQPGFGITVSKNGQVPSPSASGGVPPKPAKSSRVVSGQLAEASHNKGDPPVAEELPQSQVGRLLAATFKAVPRYREALAINTQQVIQSKLQSAAEDSVKTLRRNVLIVFADGSVKVLPPQQEYTLYDESVFICSHTYVSDNGTKVCQIYIWSGDTAFETTLEAAYTTAKRISKENGSAFIHSVRQGFETAAFLQTMGGILITRQGAPESAPKQFILCGRKVLGNIVFDEVDFAVESLCAGFVYLVSYPVTLQDTRLYVWKGSACSFEELSAARLAAMDLSETGDIIEVDGGVEFTSFLKIFGTNTTKRSIIKPTKLWLQKAIAPTKFDSRLYRIQQAPQRTGLMTALWNRRPSWNSRSPARSSPSPSGMEVKVEAKEISPILQSQLEAEGIYLLDAYCELYILLGPLFASTPEHTRNTVLGQTLLFASDYAIMAASIEDRPQIPNCLVVFSGVPRDVKMIFRHWDEGRGLWGTAGLMAGNMASSGGAVTMFGLDDVLNEVCRD